MKKLDQLTIGHLTSYAEMLTRSVQELDEFGMQTTECATNGGITVNERDEVHKKLVQQIQIFEDKRILLVKELTKRIKRDIGVNRGPGDVAIMLNGLAKDFPMIGRSKAEIELLKKKDEIIANSEPEVKKPSTKGKSSVKASLSKI